MWACRPCEQSPGVRATRQGNTDSFKPACAHGKVVRTPTHLPQRLAAHGVGGRGRPAARARLEALRRQLRRRLVLAQLRVGRTWHVKKAFGPTPRAAQWLLISGEACAHGWSHGVARAGTVAHARPLCPLHASRTLRMPMRPPPLPLHCLRSTRTNARCSRMRPTNSGSTSWLHCVLGGEGGHARMKQAGAWGNSGVLCRMLMPAQQKRPCSAAANVRMRPWMMA